ncbi:MAG: hypothetical protein ABIO78_09960, partial [Thermoanaerobaculia bacterium]
MTNASRFLLSLTVVIVAVATVIAQSPAAGTSTTSTATTATTGTSVQQTLEEILEEPAGGDTYRYDPQGRRD